MGAAGPAPARARIARTPVRTVDAVARERRRDRLRVARMVGRHEPRTRLDDRRRARRSGRRPGRARSRSDRHRARAGWPAAPGPGSPRGSSRCGMCSMPSIGGTFVVDPTATTTFRPPSSWTSSSWRTSTRPRPDDPGGAADTSAPASSRASRGSRRPAPRRRRAVDHVVATGGRPRPVVRRRVRGVAGGRVQAAPSRGRSR